MRYIITALIIGLLSIAAPAQAYPYPEEFHSHGVRECKYEDGSGTPGRLCVWDVKHSGNSRGDLSMLIRWGGEDRARYKEITHRRAHNLIERWAVYHPFKAHRYQYGVPACGNEEGTGAAIAAPDYDDPADTCIWDHEHRVSTMRGDDNLLIKWGGDGGSYHVITHDRAHRLVERYNTLHGITDPYENAANKTRAAGGDFWLTYTHA